jgi:NAD(P)-dependent dehydrogenase (short-subunit alcohol dehydrogenase family)
MRILVFGGDSDMAKEIKNNFPDVILVSKDECDVKEFISVRLTIQRYSPDVIINCAGISYPGEIDLQNENDWLFQVDTNLVGSYNIIKNGGKDKTYILIASVAGMYGKPNHSAYSVSKGAIITLVQSAAKEGYKAYAISPGRVNTKMREKDYPGEDIKTRLTTKQISDVVADIINGKYQFGDNIVIRKKGYETFKRIDRGQPWKKYLNL